MTHKRTNPAGQGEVCESGGRLKNDRRDTHSSRTTQQNLCEIQTTKLRRVYASTFCTAATIARLAFEVVR